MNARRNIYGLSTVAALVLACASTSVCAETISSTKIRQNLYATCFISDTEGWAVGDLGRIFHSTDGGQSWERQSVGTNKKPFVAISCLDANHVWLAGQAGQIAFSGDGGQSWQFQNSGTHMQLLDIEFSDAQHGVAVGNFGLMLRTTDGGQSWQRLAVPDGVPQPMEALDPPSKFLLYSVTYADPMHIRVAGEFGLIIGSDDGGDTWFAQNSTVETTLFGIFFADAQRGWATGLESTLLATTDGGTTWQRQRVETPAGFSLSLYDVQVQGGHGWAVGHSGYLLYSSDSGSTWRLVKTPPQLGSYWFREVSLRPTGKGVAVGRAGIVLTLDGAQFTPLKDRI